MGPVEGVAIAASGAGVAADGVSLAEEHAGGLEAADLSGGCGVDDDFGGAPSWPPKRPQAGLAERSNQRLILVSVVIRYSRMMPLPSRHRPGPAESWR